MNTKLIKYLRFGSELPKQLEIRGGKLRLIGSDDEPYFDLPDGELVNILPHEDAKKVLNDAFLFRNGGA